MWTCKIICTVLVSLAFVTTATFAQSDPDAKDIKDVRVRLTQLAERLASDSYQPVNSETTELVKKSGVESFPLTLRAGTGYAIIAACDLDCTRIGVALQDAKGQVIARSNEETHTVSVFVRVRETGSFKAEVAVPGCQEDECYAGILLLAQGPPAPASRAPAAAFTAHDNYDIDGGDLKRLPDVELQQCISACQADVRCLAYSFDKWHDWCFLKDRADRFRLEPNTVTGLRSEVPKPPLVSTPIKIHRYPNKAFPYGGEDANKSETRDTCEDRCQQATTCVAYTFFKHSKQCRLMQTVAAFPIADPRADSGAKRQEPGQAEQQIIATAPAVEPRPAGAAVAVGEPHDGREHGKEPIGRATTKYVTRDVCGPLIHNAVAKENNDNETKSIELSLSASCERCFADGLQAALSRDEQSALDLVLTGNSGSLPANLIERVQKSYEGLFALCSDRLITQISKELFVKTK